MKKMKRVTAGFLAATLVLGNSMDALAASGYGQFHNAVTLPFAERTFASDAQSQIDADMGGGDRAGTWVATGLAEEMTSTLRSSSAPKGIQEPLGYGKWWYRKHGDVSIKGVRYRKDPTKRINVDFSKLAGHYNSCIENHVSNEVSTTQTNGVKYEGQIGCQAFADYAYLPVTGAYPDFIAQSSGDTQTLKFKMLLMSLLHANHPIPSGAEWDSRWDTQYSIMLFYFTRIVEANGFRNGVLSSPGADYNELCAFARGDIVMKYINPNNAGENLFDDFIGNPEVKDYFVKQWKAAAFLTYFGYEIADGSNSGGSSGGKAAKGPSDGSGNSPGALETGVAITLPLTPTAPSADGGYERHFDYGVENSVDDVKLSPAPDIIRDYFTNLTVKLPSDSKIKFTKSGTQLIFTAPTAEELDNGLGNLEILLGEDGSAFREESKTMAPGGLVSMRSASVSEDMTDLAIGGGQLRFGGYTLPFKATPGHYSGGGGETLPDEPTPIVRYQHTETFQADYTVNLRKFDSETGKGLKGSHFDILEAFPDANGQLGATELESEENWGNDNGSQFLKWKGWDYGSGNPDGDQGNDPCNIDDDVTDTNGLLKYSAGTGTAHTDTKTYTYTKGFCGGHPAKPEPEEDPETGEILNEKEIEDWENEVATCEDLISESNTGYFCATAENGYENGEDEDGSESKKEMEDDRDKYYEQFISLTYDYSAKEIKARDGYILHDIHTDDIPIETKTVTSSQYKDYNASCGGNVTNLPHQDSPSGGNSGGGGGGGSEDPGEDGDVDNDYEYEEYKYTGTITAMNSSKITIKSDDGDQYRYSTDKIYDLLSEEDIEHLTKGCRVSVSIIVFQGEEYIDYFEFSTDPDAYKDPKKSRKLAQQRSDAAALAVDAAEDEDAGQSDKSVTADVYVSSTAGKRVTIATASDAESMPDIEGDEYFRHLADFEASHQENSKNDTEPEEDDDAEETISDIELANDLDLRGSVAEVSVRKATASNATASDADLSTAVQAEKESWIQTVVKNVQELVEQFFTMCQNGIRYAISLFAADDDGGSGASHPVRDSVKWTPDGPGNYVTPLASDIVDHTFTVFDHRTEGEIHINKRDLDLEMKHSDQYDSYADENGDGTLEGAVYGLFAKEDIIHPDGHTDVVYQKDDLVAVATTDRNGDASFMVFTEAPGRTYDYDQGAIVKRTDSPFDGPDNLHKPQADGDAVSEDNEAYIGHDSNNQEMSLTDSDEGDATVYYKHSSNQDGIEGLTGGHEVYPILNNEENNGNCWIGRPLIANPNGSNYYIKELSRSEGYELSVTGKTNEVTNGKDSQNTEKDTQMVTVGSLTEDNAKNGWTFSVIGKNLTGDVHISASSKEGAEFVATTLVEEPCEIEVEEKTEVKTPVIGVKDTQVILNGGPVEASVGDSVNVNGTSYTVTNVSAKEEQTMGAIPVNTKMFGLPSATTYHSADVNDFIAKYNQALLDMGYRTPDANAPWIRVKISGTSDTDWIAVLSGAMRDYGLIYFNRVRIVDAVANSDGSTSLIIRYDYAAKKEPSSCVYNPDQAALYVKQDSGSGYFVYVKVPLDSTDIISVDRNDEGFVKSAILKKFTVSCGTSYPNALPAQDGYAKTYTEAKSYWLYDGVMQQFNNDGTLATTSSWVTTTHKEPSTQLVEKTTALPFEYADGNYMVTIPKNLFGTGTVGKVTVRMQGKENSKWYYRLNKPILSYVPANENEDSYIGTATLSWKNEKTIVDDAKTMMTPLGVNERSLRQKIRIDKDIQKLKESKSVWYCLNCGYENADGDAICGFCGHNRTTEKTKTIDYAHDTYGAVHSENISADREDGWYETVKDWFAKLLKLESKDESTESIGNFRFKAYLKSNLERLYRKADGTITWVDRNGNEMIPQYEDKAADDGNYDTFTWKYKGAFDGKTVDFPEKDKTSADGTLESSNVQKIYTEVEHNKDSRTSSARANNVWASYGTPQGGNTADVGDIQSYTTSERGASGQAVKNNSSLYSYDGKLVDADRSDKLNDTANSGYTRILESTLTTIEDEGTTREVEMYNYEKFFDAIHAANTDIWDDDMHSTFTGDAMKNYPGQHWFKTFYEKYQKDDTDPGHTKANTDGADKDGTAGGDKDTSFKPFRWIRENVFGYRDGYEKYPADNNGVNTEVTANTSDFARANAEASDAVRQFAVKWYLQDEAAKLMVDNGQGENVALKSGTIGYDEAVYDEALFNAIAKAYNYLKPFYFYDLDTIYSVEWDSVKNGGADKDYTTLSVDELHNGTYYNISSYLPYGVYVIVEQQPERRDKDVNDWKNRSYDIEKPKEVIVPSVYDAEKSNDTSDNYDPHYNFDTDMALQKQAKASNYLIRFGEELSANTENQDEREFAIRAHGYYGDFEVYKYGLDIDGLSGTITAPNGAYGYHGWELRQGYRDPLKDYYEYDHRGEAGITEIGAERGGNNESKYHGYEQENGNGKDTANGETYDGDTLRKRFFYASVSEDDGTADNVLYKDGAKDDNNASGMNWKDNIPSTTGELTAYDKLYSAALVPWSVTAPANLDIYSSKDFTGYADVKERNRYYVSYLKVNKVDSETGEYILHDDAIFGLYAASRYTSFDEIEEDAKLIKDADERARFLMQFKPGDAKFYLKDTHIVGSKEFLEAMGATDLQISTGRARTPIVESQEDTGHTYTGLVRKGTPVCVESERIDLSDDFGKKTGQMTVWSTKADVKMDDPVTGELKDYGDQNVGYFKTSQPVSAGVYVLAELKPPAGYARSKPVAIEVYSDKTSYYVDGDMYAKVAAVRYDGNLLTDIPYEK